MTLLAKLRDWVRARLIADWTRAHKFTSVQLAAAGALLEGFVQWFPGTATEIWNALPGDMRGLLPTWLTSSLPVVLLVAIAVARITRKVKPDGE